MFCTTASRGSVALPSGRAQTLAANTRRLRFDRLHIARRQCLCAEAEGTHRGARQELEGGIDVFACTDSPQFAFYMRPGFATDAPTSFRLPNVSYMAAK